MRSADEEFHFQRYSGALLQAQAKGGVGEPLPGRDELTALFSDWKIEDAIHCSPRSVAYRVHGEREQLNAYLTMRRGKNPAVWKGAKPPLEHPHIVPILEWGVSGDMRYLIFTRPGDFTLAEALESGLISRKALVRDLRPAIASAVAASSELGIELDTRPAAVLYDRTGTVRLCPLLSDEPEHASDDYEGVDICPGVLIDRYALIDSLGEGGFAEVYLAEQREPIKRRVAFVAKSRTADGKVVPVSLWNFDGNYGNAVEGGPPIRVVGNPAVSFERSRIGEESAETLSFPRFLVTEYLTADNPIGPNGHDFATDTNEYTLVMDVMFPAFDNDTALMQAGVGNHGSAELLISKESILCCHSSEGVRVSPGAWTRVGLTVHARGKSEVVQMYVNGARAGRALPQGNVDSHMGINEEILFFADGNGDTAAGYVNSIALYDVVLTEREMASLGKASAAGVPARIEAIASEPVLPESVKAADYVIIPPEPGRNHPTYRLEVTHGRLLVYKPIVGGWAGGAWLYRKAGKTWKHTLTFEREEQVQDEWVFAAHAVVSESWAAVTALAEPVEGHPEAGAIYMYRRDEPEAVQRIPSPAPSTTRIFGHDAELTVSRLLVRVLGRDGHADHTCIYELNELTGEWDLTTVHPSYFQTGAFPDPETLFLIDWPKILRRFKRVDASWQEVGRHEPEGERSHFGTSVDYDENTLLVSWPRPHTREPAEVTIFRRHHGGENNWGLSGRITAPQFESDHYFGWRAALDGDRVFVSRVTADKKSVFIHLFAKQDGVGEIWSLKGPPLILRDVDNHELTSRHAVASSSYDSGRVLIYDLEKWASSLEKPSPASQILNGPESQPGAHFGQSLAVSEGQAIIGAPLEDETSGAFYVFEKNAEGQWSQVERLVSSRPDRGTRFGWDVDLGGNVAVVGAPSAKLGEHDRAGAVYVFNRDAAGRWIETVKLTSSALQHGEEFGTSVALDGRWLAIGAPAPLGPTGSGSVYLFCKQEGIWAFASRIEAGETRPRRGFGSRVELQGDRLLVGAPGGGDDPGCAEMYERSSTGEWTRIARLEPPDGRGGDEFGSWLSLDRGTVAVGAPGCRVGNEAQAGAVFIFEETGKGEWEFRKRVASPVAESLSRFGFCQLYGDLLIVGESSGQAGAGGCYVYERNASGPGEWGLVRAYHGESDVDYSGTGLALENGQLFMGEGSGEDSGRVYILEYP